MNCGIEAGRQSVKCLLLIEKTLRLNHSSLLNYISLDNGGAQTGANYLTLLIAQLLPKCQAIAVIPYQT
jgi:hypothetical protein